MTAADPLTAWATLSPLERASVRDVYFGERSVTETARRQGIGAAEVSRALQSAYRRIAAYVLEPETPTVPVWHGGR